MSVPPSLTHGRDYRVMQLDMMQNRVFSIRSSTPAPAAGKDVHIQLKLLYSLHLSLTLCLLAFMQPQPINCNQFSCKRYLVRL